MEIQQLNHSMEIDAKLPFIEVGNTDDDQQAITTSSAPIATTEVYVTPILKDSQDALQLRQPCNK